MVSNLISNLGNMLTSLAVPWFVLEPTGSATKTGLTAAVTLIPVIIASFFGGALADRASRRGLSVPADLMSSLTLAAAPFFYLTTGLSFPGLLQSMFLGAIFDAPGGTARQAMVPELAERASMPLERVNSAFGVNQAVSMLLGAPLVGIMIARLGPVNVLWFAAGAFVVSIGSMLIFVPALARTAPSGTSYLHEVREGFTWLLRNRLMRTLVLAALIINMVVSPIFGVAIPLFAKQQFGSASDLGIMMSGMGVGALIGSLGYGLIGQRFSPRTIMLTAVPLLGAPFAGLAFLPSLWVSWGLLLITGIGSGMVNPLLQTMVQTQTPPSRLGRMMGALIAGSMVAAPIGLLLGGSVIAAIGLSGTLLVAAGVISPSSCCWSQAGNCAKST
ncbi:MAG: MFS transporter [Thermomicrobiales bacterium]